MSPPQIMRPFSSSTIARKVASFGTFSRKRSRGAFSLLELLVVIAIIALLATGTTSLFSGDQGVDQKKALIQIANAFETARQVAVSQNTYTYVGFTSPVSTNAADPLCVAVFQSETGQDILQTGGSIADAQLITRIAWLRNVQIDYNKEPPEGLISEEELKGTQFSETVDPLPSGPGFTVLRKVGDMPVPAPLAFNRVVTFMPNGAALVKNTRGLPAGLIGFMVKPLVGNNLDAKTAAVTVSGFLGNVRFYQR